MRWRRPLAPRVRRTTHRQRAEFLPPGFDTSLPGFCSPRKTRLPTILLYYRMEIFIVDDENRAFFCMIRQQSYNQKRASKIRETYALYGPSRRGQTRSSCTSPSPKDPLNEVEQESVPEDPKSVPTSCPLHAGDALVKSAIHSTTR